MSRLNQSLATLLGLAALVAIGWFSGLIPLILSWIQIALQFALFLFLLPIVLAILGIINFFMPRSYR
ncbi:MAG: hypothetical protein ACLROE_08030 [Collinsella intestinalis]|uniref:hypothetical protein n=1 Tax=Collinsella intestinalis TaxID=147207 RepID=UPI003A23E6FF